MFDSFVYGDENNFVVGDFPNSIYRNNSVNPVYYDVYFDSDKNYSASFIQYYNNFDSVNGGRINTYFNVPTYGYLYLFSDEIFLPFNYSGSLLCMSSSSLSGLDISVSYKIWYYDDDLKDFSYNEDSYVIKNLGAYSTFNLIRGSILSTSLYNYNDYIYITDYVLSISNDTAIYASDNVFSISYDLVDKSNLSKIYFGDTVVVFDSPGTWLLNSLDAFLSFELVPGFSLSTLLGMMVLVPLILFLCKLFLGG